MTQVCIESSTSKILIESLIEFIVTNQSHDPDDREDEHPSSGRVQALESVILVQWVEEQLAETTIIHGTAKSIKEKSSTDHGRGPHCITELLPDPEHFPPVTHINDSLGEEYSIVVYHQEDLVKILILSLHFPVVQADRGKWANQFDKKGIFVSIMDLKDHLGRVDHCHYAT